jgi:hypothetical protein
MTKRKKKKDRETKKSKETARPIGFVVVIVSLACLSAGLACLLALSSLGQVLV